MFRHNKTKSTFSAAKTYMKAQAALGLFADTAAKKMEVDAKRNAPWTDRTSNARNSIQGSFGWKNRKLVITLSGNMDYSVWLELANDKRYAILYPTIQKNAPEVLRAYKKVI
jgi:hypothetical protein